MSELYKARKFLDGLTKVNWVEYSNILDRLMINIINNDASAFKKARSECVEKNIPAVFSYDVEKTVIAAKNKYNKTATTKATTFPKELQEMKAFLIKQYPDIKKVEIEKCVFRYAAIGMRGQQWRLDSNYVSKFKSLGITTEAFASPFNHYTVDASQSETAETKSASDVKGATNSMFVYFSAFDEDKIFGSQGSFLDPKNRSVIKGGIYANPPFTPFMLEQMATIMCGYEKAIIITPTWSDAPWYAKLKECGYTPHIKTNTTYELLGKSFIPRFTTTLWSRLIDITSLEFDKE